MPVSPTLRRRRLAAELKALRIAKDLTIEQASAGIGMSAATLSRIENGKSGVKPPMLRALLSVYGITGQHAMNLELLAQEANRREWWQSLTTSDEIKALVGLEAEASWVKFFGNSFVLGSLQTEAYARAMVEAIRFDGPSDVVNDVVKARMQKQETLPQPSLKIILAEEGLMRPIGGQRVMADQVDHLVVASKKPDIELQVLSRSAGAHVGLAGNFEILGLPPSSLGEAVYVEGAQWEAVIEDSDQIAHYTRSFDRLRALALGFGESRALLAKIAEEYRAASN